MEGVKEFVVYTLMRLGLFIASAGVIGGVWALLADSVNILVVVILAFLVSGAASWYFLDQPREALARKVEDRASRSKERFADLKAREDVD